MELLNGKWLLDDLSIVKFSGLDAGNFLHGQLSNSVNDLQPGLARPMAYCTAQGRLLANGFYWQLADNEYAVLISADLVESFVRRIKMFVLRSKVQIEAMDKLRVTGVIGQQNLPNELHDLPAWDCHFDGKNYWVRFPGGDIPAAWCIGENDSSNNDNLAWHAYQLENGWPFIRMATQGKFLPSSLNMDLNGSINFNKGCYPGQEIIARSHYRGTVKRRMAFADAPIIDACPTDLSDLYDLSGKPIARVIESVVYNKHIYACVEINTADYGQQKFMAGKNGPTMNIKLLQAELVQN